MNPSPRTTTLTVTFTLGLLTAGLLAGCATAPTSTSSPSASVDRHAAVGTCDGGDGCAIGDIGPGGGRVFYDAGAEQSWGRYMEVAPADWNGESQDTMKEVWCDKYTEIAGALSESIGSGFHNTSAMVASCSSGAANKAEMYTHGGKADWFLPSVKELEELWRQRKVIGIDGSDHYWSSSKSTDSYPISLAFLDGRRWATDRNEEECVRPVRTI